LAAWRASIRVKKVVLVPIGTAITTVLIQASENVMLGGQKRTSTTFLSSRTR